MVDGAAVVEVEVVVVLGAGPDVVVGLVVVVVDAVVVVGGVDVGGGVVLVDVGTVVVAGACTWSTNVWPSPDVSSLNRTR